MQPKAIVGTFARLGMMAAVVVGLTAAGALSAAAQGRSSTGGDGAAQLVTGAGKGGGTQNMADPTAKPGVTASDKGVAGPKNSGPRAGNTKSGLVKQQYEDLLGRKSDGTPKVSGKGVVSDKGDGSVKAAGKGVLAPKNAGNRDDRPGTNGDGKAELVTQTGKKGPVSAVDKTAAGMNEPKKGGRTRP